MQNFLQRVDKRIFIGIAVVLLAIILVGGIFKLKRASANTDSPTSSPQVEGDLTEASPTDTPTNTPTDTPIPTDTPTDTPVATDTPTTTPTPTNTPTPTPTPANYSANITSVNPSSAPADNTSSITVKVNVTNNQITDGGEKVTITYTSTSSGILKINPSWISADQSGNATFTITSSNPDTYTITPNVYDHPAGTTNQLIFTTP